jgi:hypothetical protein
MAGIAALAIAAMVAAVVLQTPPVAAGPPQVAAVVLQTPPVAAGPPQMGPQGPWNAAGFQGAWCAQGDRNKPCSISVNGAFLSLTNEAGSTSSGTFGGMNQNTITAMQWNFVQGTLSPDGSRINWTNGTFWARCSSGGGGHRPPNLDGTWYRDGKRSMSCSIRQNKRSLRLRNESGQTGTGTVDGKWHVTSNWAGTTVAGTISPDGNTIYWNNGTSWSR